MFGFMKVLFINAYYYGIHHHRNQHAIYMNYLMNIIKILINTTNSPVMNTIYILRLPNIRIERWILGIIFGSFVKN